jgi:hypothetical protein
MARFYPDATSHVTLRVLWLFGLFTLISNAAFLFGYYLLPEGSLRQGPQTAAGRAIAASPNFVAELLLTLLFNLGIVVVVAVVMNLNKVNGFPVGYLYPFVMGLVAGLIPGTNSFAASDLADFNVREGMALNISIGGLEMLGYICVTAATVKLGLYEYRSWWRWRGEWKAVKTKNLREVRLCRAEVLILALGISLVLVAAIRETMMARGSL